MRGQYKDNAFGKSGMHLFHKETGWVDFARLLGSTNNRAKYKRKLMIALSYLPNQTHKNFVIDLAQRRVSMA